MSVTNTVVNTALSKIVPNPQNFPNFKNELSSIATSNGMYNATAVISLINKLPVWYQGKSAAIAQLQPSIPTPTPTPTSTSMGQVQNWTNPSNNGVFTTLGGKGFVVIMDTDTFMQLVQNGGFVRS
jgi:hypothetical protein